MPFGTERSWSADDIWLRRSSDLDEMPAGRLVRNVWNDSPDEVRLNGELLISMEPSRHFVLVECGATLRRLLVVAEHVVASLPQ